MSGDHDKKGNNLRNVVGTTSLLPQAIVRVLSEAAVPLFPEAGPEEDPEGGSRGKTHRSQGFHRRGVSFGERPVRCPQGQPTPREKICFLVTGFRSSKLALKGRGGAQS